MLIILWLPKHNSPACRVIQEKVGEKPPMGILQGTNT